MTQDIVPRLQVARDGNIPALTLLDQLIGCPLCPVIPAFVYLEEFKGRLVNIRAITITIREVVQHWPFMLFRP